LNLLKKIEENYQHKVDSEVTECTHKPKILNFKGFKHVEVYKKPDKTYTYQQECQSKLT
jgi:hypothetical protein